MTTNGRQPQIESQHLLTSNGRRPQMEDYLKYQKQQLVGSFPNFKLRLMGPKQTLQMFQIKTTYNGRRHQMEDYLKYQK